MGWYGKLQGGRSVEGIAEVAVKDSGTGTLVHVS